MNTSKQKIVAYWLMLGALLVVIQVLLGGITRITESGLSITEWQPIDGSLPPFNQADWLILFEKYKQTDQFLYLKKDISINEFKDIFFWEWFHRNWARLIGIVFIFPFLHFIYHKYISKKQAWQYTILLGLGGIQGLMGWLMVKSGLQKGNVFVDHIFLAIHFMLALITLAVCIYFALDILIDKKHIYRHNGQLSFLKKLFYVLMLQLIYGAFMSGMHAAPYAPTWPSINGALIPQQLWEMCPPIYNFFYNKITVHFIHRLLAYILLVLMIVWIIKIRKNKILVLQISTYILAVLLLLQISLGISALFTAHSRDAFRLIAVAHQFVGMSVFILFIIMLFVVRK